MPSLVVIGPQIKEKQRRGGGGQCAPAYMVPKDPSLNRVKYGHELLSPCAQL